MMKANLALIFDRIFMVHFCAKFTRKFTPKLNNFWLFSQPKFSPSLFFLVNDETKSLQASYAAQQNLSKV